MTDGFRRPDPSWLRDELVALDSAGLRRRRVQIRRTRPGWIEVEGKDYVDFASNDYLGLAADSRVRAAVVEFLAENAWGAAASPLVTGYHPAHETLERELADFEGVEAVIMAGSGYAGNVGVVAAIAGKDDVIFSEKRNHASLIDGCRQSRADVNIYSSDQLEELERELAQAAGYRRRWIITDSVFSMDGDLAPLVDLCILAERYDANIFLDEAHATGVLGANGRGAAEQLGVEGRIALRLGTLGKALGSVGAFVATSATWADWLVQRMRPYIYSTALPPACAFAASAALRILRNEPERRRKSKALADQLRTGLDRVGIPTGESATPIIPVILGTPEAAFAAAQEFREQGLWATPIRPPTVPAGTSRLRLTVCAAHEKDQIERAVLVSSKFGNHKNSD